jgi:hypothetical protein
MSPRYTRQQKLKALTLLRASHGSVRLASIHTGIPERILHRWKARLQPRTREQTMRELFNLALAAEDEAATAGN